MKSCNAKIIIFMVENILPYYLGKKKDYKHITIYTSYYSTRFQMVGIAWKSFPKMLVSMRVPLEI